MREIALALVHAPVLDKAGAEMTSTVTNLDVHDLARTARTYGLSRYFVVTPIEAQRELVRRICEHWTSGSSAQRIPTRQRALALVEPVATLEDAKAALGDRTEVWATAARKLGRAILEHRDARERLQGEGSPVLLVLGTSWGLAPRVVSSADALLAPIDGRTDFNHLSVRAAGAILCDRLLG